MSASCGGASADRPFCATCSKPMKQRTGSSCRGTARRYCSPRCKCVAGQVVAKERYVPKSGVRRGPPGRWRYNKRPGVAASCGRGGAEGELRYIVCAGGHRTWHESFLEARVEYLIRSGRAAA